MIINYVYTQNTQMIKNTEASHFVKTISDKTNTQKTQFEERILSTYCIIMFA